MSVTTFDSRTPFQITLSVPAEVEEGMVILTEENFVPVGTGAVQSVFGRTGAVVAAADDYAASEVENDSGVAGDSVGDALDTLDTAVGVAQVDATQALADAAVVWLAVTLSVQELAAGSVYVPAPVTGALTSVRTSPNGNPGGALAVTTSIGGVAVTNGALSVPNGAAAGSLQSATPTAANAVTLGTSTVGVAWDAGAASAITVTALLGFTRA